MGAYPGLAIVDQYEAKTVNALSTKVIVVDDEGDTQSDELGN